MTKRQLTKIIEDKKYTRIFENHEDRRKCVKAEDEDFQYYLNKVSGKQISFHNSSYYPRIYMNMFSGLYYEIELV